MELSGALPVVGVEAGGWVEDGLVDAGVLGDHGVTFGDGDLGEEGLVEQPAVRASGLLGLLVPETFGGLGGSLVDMVEVAQVLAGVTCAVAGAAEER